MRKINNELCIHILYLLEEDFRLWTPTVISRLITRSFVIRNIWILVLYMNSCFGHLHWQSCERVGNHQNFDESKNNLNTYSPKFGTNVTFNFETYHLPCSVSLENRQFLKCVRFWACFIKLFVVFHFCYTTLFVRFSKFSQVLYL